MAYCGREERHLRIPLCNRHRRCHADRTGLSCQLSDPEPNVSRYQPCSGAFSQRDFPAHQKRCDCRTRSLSLGAQLEDNRRAPSSRRTARNHGGPIMPTTRYKNVARNAAVQDSMYAMVLTAVSVRNEDTSKPFDDEELRKLKFLLSLAEILGAAWGKLLNAGAEIHVESLTPSDLRLMVILMNQLHENGSRILVQAGLAPCAITV